MSIYKLDSNWTADASRSLVVSGKKIAEGEHRMRSTQSLRSAEGRRKVLKWLQASGWWHAVGEDWASASSPEKPSETSNGASPTKEERKIQESEQMPNAYGDVAHVVLKTTPAVPSAVFADPNPQPFEASSLGRLPVHIAKILSRTTEELSRRRPSRHMDETGDFSRKQVMVSSYAGYSPDVSNVPVSESLARDVSQSAETREENLSEKHPPSTNAKLAEHGTCGGACQGSRPLLSTPAQPRRKLTGAQRRRVDRKFELAQQVAMTHHPKISAKAALMSGDATVTDMSTKTPTVSPLSGDRASPLKRKRSSQRSTAKAVAAPNLSGRRSWLTVTPAQRRLTFDSSSESEHASASESEETVTEDESVELADDDSVSAKRRNLSLQQAPISLQPAYQSHINAKPKTSKRVSERVPKAICSPELSTKKKRDVVTERPAAPKNTRGKQQGPFAIAEQQQRDRLSTKNRHNNRTPDKTGSLWNPARAKDAHDAKNPKGTRKSKKMTGYGGSSPAEWGNPTASSMPRPGPCGPSQWTEGAPSREHDPGYWQTERERASARRAVYYNARYWSQANMAAYVAHLHPMQTRMPPYLAASSLMIPRVAPPSAFVSTVTNPVLHAPANIAHWQEVVGLTGSPGMSASMPVQTLYPGFVSNAGTRQDDPTEVAKSNEST